MSKVVAGSITMNLVGDSLSNILSAAISNSTSPYTVDHRALAAAFQSLTAPNDSGNPVKIAVIIPPTTSTFVKTLKGVTGDTGIGITGAGWTNQPAVIAMGNGQVWGILGGGVEQVDIYYF